MSKQTLTDNACKIRCFFCLLNKYFIQDEIQVFSEFLRVLYVERLYNNTHFLTNVISIIPKITSETLVVRVEYIALNGLDLSEIELYIGGRFEHHSKG
jgi:hypothetical protein